MSIKYCIRCNNELIPDINWTKGMQKAGSYICRNCHNKKSKGWKINNPEKYKESELKYCHSVKGRVTRSEYQQSKKGKISQVESNKKYNQSLEGKATRIRYNQSKHGKLVKAKSNRKYSQTKNGKTNRRKSKSKRRQNLGNIPMFANPFHESIDVRWHHITDVYTVAIPTDLHELLSGYKADKHRELVMVIVKQIYLGDD